MPCFFDLSEEEQAAGSVFLSINFMAIFMHCIAGSSIQHVKISNGSWHLSMHTTDSSVPSHLDGGKYEHRFMRTLTLEFICTEALPYLSLRSLHSNFA